MKRILDISFALSGFILFLPAFIVIPLFIRLEDGGAVFFRQLRLGQYKRPFRIVKFRSMRNGNVTRIGRWLRASGLDELPQFYNVLLGDMSIVGPRPLTFADTQRLGWDHRFHICRWHLKPGITGMAQLYAGRGAKVSWFFDKRYVREQTTGMDLRIILLTTLMNLFGKRRIRAWLQARLDRSPDWQRWVRFFSVRRERNLPEPFIVQDNLAPSIARSLAIFQLGESGGGTISGQVRCSRLTGIDRAYARAVELFVDEEHRHAKILAVCVRALGGQLIRKNWTAQLFVVARRMMGLRLKVLVLLAAEVVGICYYKLLALRLADAQLSRLLTELARDEEAHLKFHSAFLRYHTQGIISGFLFSLVWRLVTFTAAIVVTIDHHRALKDLDIPLRLVWQRWMYLVRETELQVLTNQPDYQFLQQVDMRYI